MAEEPKEEKVEEVQEGEIIPPDLFSEDFDDTPMNVGEVLPTMNVVAPEVPEDEKCIVDDNVLLDLYKEGLDDVRRNNSQLDEVLTNVIDMVFNDGDATPASKEMLVNLLKIKSDNADKKAKYADLMTRIKLKENNTYKPYLNAHQHNHVTIETPKRDILKQIKMNELKKKKGQP
jgi:hypothetical protein